MRSRTTFKKQDQQYNSHQIEGMTVWLKNYFQCVLESNQRNNKYVVSIQ